VDEFLSRAAPFQYRSMASPRDRQFSRAISIPPIRGREIRARQHRLMFEDPAAGRSDPPAENARRAGSSSV
jgi:hypothetical protein